MPSWPDIFKFGFFLSISLSNYRCMLASGPSLSPWNTFFKLFIHSTFVIFFPFQYTTIELISFFCSQLLLFSCILHLLVIIFLYFGLICFLCSFALVSVYLKYPFFRQYLRIYLFKLYYQTSQLFRFVLFIPAYSCVFFLPSHFSFKS